MIHHSSPTDFRARYQRQNINVAFDTSGNEFSPNAAAIIRQDKFLVSPNFMRVCQQLFPNEFVNNTLQELLCGVSFFTDWIFILSPGNPTVGTPAIVLRTVRYDNDQIVHVTTEFRDITITMNCNTAVWYPHGFFADWNTCHRRILPRAIALQPAPDIVFTPFETGTLFDVVHAGLLSLEKLATQTDPVDDVLICLNTYEASDLPGWSREHRKMAEVLRSDVLFQCSNRRIAFLPINCGWDRFVAEAAAFDPGTIILCAHNQIAANGSGELWFTEGTSVRAVNQKNKPLTTHSFIYLYSCGAAGGDGTYRRYLKKLFNNNALSFHYTFVTLQEVVCFVYQYLCIEPQVFGVSDIALG